MKCETNKRKLSTQPARWAAAGGGGGGGAAVAVTVGAGGGFGLAQAAVDTGERPVFISSAPCRSVDTRTAEIGERSSPLGPGTVHTVDANDGDCGVPADALAIVGTLTAPQATGISFVTVYPGDGDVPLASNLNVEAGTVAKSTQVTVDLDDQGRFSIYNFENSVDAIFDVTGYFVDHSHAEYEQPAPQSRVASYEDYNSQGLSSELDVVAETSIETPGAGSVLVDVSSVVREVESSDSVTCQLSASDSNFFDEAPFLDWRADSHSSLDADFDTISGNRVFQVDGSEPELTVRYRCLNDGGGNPATIRNISMSLLFVPAPNES